MRYHQQLHLIILSILFVLSQNLKNGMGLTPPMGWNSWNHFGCNISENLIKKTADALVKSGLAAKGYVYVNLDDCWQTTRNHTTQEIIADPDKFPSGIESLAQYVHSKGLKLGLYSDAGATTCQHRPGSFGFENIDARTYAKWKVDYLKYDNCNHNNESAKVRYTMMRDALSKVNQSIFYSISNWGEEGVTEWGALIGNSWRTTQDINDSWDSFTNILDEQQGLEKHSGPGAWNDLDMLEVGNGGMSYLEDQAHFVLWSVLKSPLLIGCDIVNIASETLEILSNEEVIAVNQDKLSKQAHRFKRDSGVKGFRDYYAGELTQSRYIVVLFNRDIVAAQFMFSLQNDLRTKGIVSCKIRDILMHKDIGTSFRDKLAFGGVQPHSVQAYILTPRY